MYLPRNAQSHDGDVAPPDPVDSILGGLFAPPVPLGQHHLVVLVLCRDVHQSRHVILGNFLYCKDLQLPSGKLHLLWDPKYRPHIIYFSYPFQSSITY